MGRDREVFVRRIIFSLIILFALSGSAGASILLDKVVAIIDRDVITWSELYRAMSFEYEAQTRGMKPEEKKKYFESQQAGFLEKLITMRLLIAEAKRAGFSVSDAETKAAINDIRAQYNLSEDQFREALKKEGFEFNDYTRHIQEQILINKIVNSEVRSKIVVNDDEVENYFNAHRDELPLNLVFKLSQIQFKRPSNDDEKNRVQGLIDQIDNSVREGANFTDSIRSLKNDPLVQFAGETDYLRSSDLREDILTILKNTDEGGITAPIETTDGIFLFQVIKKEIPVSLEVIRDNIRKIIAENKGETNYQQWVKSLRQKAFIEIKL